LLAIKLMRTGAKKRPSYRIVVKEKQSKRDGAYLENLGTYNPTRDPAEINLKSERVQYWISKGAQPTDTVRRLIKQAAKAQAAATDSEAAAA
jgi:small subunit ribosomal protein S16